VIDIAIALLSELYERIWRYRYQRRGSSIDLWALGEVITLLQAIRERRRNATKQP
jgi:hypothetical protein